MNRQQEWVVVVVGVLMALISAAYGADNEEPLWAFVVPVAVIAAVVFMSLRSRPGEARPSASRSDLITDIECLVRLRETGVLSESEFARLKSALIESRSAPRKL